MNTFAYTSRRMTRDELDAINERLTLLSKELSFDNLVLNRLNNEVDKITAHRDAYQKRVDRMEKQMQDLRERKTYLELND